MILTRSDHDAIHEILRSFPQVREFELTQTCGNGIGSITSMTFSHEINNHTGQLTLKISGVEDW